MWKDLLDLPEQKGVHGSPIDGSNKKLCGGCFEVVNRLHEEAIAEVAAMVAARAAEVKGEEE